MQMKRVNHLIESVADMDNLRLAFWKASKGKRHAQAILSYGAQLEPNLARLQEQIMSGLVEVGNYRFFKVYEPKERQICASAFNEQVLHHALMNVCHQYFERVQIYDSYASRKDKGTYAAIQRAQGFTRSNAWFLKLDVRKFFASVDHEVIRGQLERMFKDWALLDIFGKIIESYQNQPDRGLPIGCLTSQYLANHYLAGLDHFIREKLRFRCYVRYMDDMVLWHPDKAALKEAHTIIRDFVENKLHCELKPEGLNQTCYGLSFLGYRIFPYHLGLTRRSKVRFIRKMQMVTENYDSGIWSEATCQRRVLPLLAFIRHADTGGFRRNLT